MRSAKDTYVPANTKRNTEWSQGVFPDWRAFRHDEKVCPPDLFETPNIEKLNFWIPHFINEVKHIDGQNGEPLVSDSEYSHGLAFGFGGMHSCLIRQVVVNINKDKVKKEDD